MLIVIYAKTLRHSFVRQLTKTLNRFFNLSRAQENLKTCTQV